MKIITTHAFKHTLKDIQEQTETRKFCFVIGAGTSRNSGIKTGGELSEKWFEEISKRSTKEELLDWMTEQKISRDNLAASYGYIYRKRFEHDKTSGYEFLVQTMKDAKPSFGHYVLAQILSRYDGHCVLTTNFDSLIESAIYQYSDKTPLVCGHESLSGYARPSNIHPLVIKIHRDLLLAPKSDPDEIGKLDQGWEQPLDQIFSTHIPIVIGYGGNDGSLMSYLEDMGKPSNFFWCGLDSTSLPDRIEKLVKKHEGSFVKIDGFDELMYELLFSFDQIKTTKEDLIEITNKRNQLVSDQYDKLKDERSLVKDSDNELSAFEYDTLAQKEPDLEKRKAIYIEALKKYPDTGWLWHRFTYFMHFEKKDYDELIDYYSDAINVDQNNSGLIGNYAVFLKNIKKNYEEAEKYYLKALTIDPDHANNNGNYAVFLKDIRKNYEESEKYYLKALTIDPDNVISNGNYAIFLKDIRKNYEESEKYYLKALTIDPDNVISNGNYAVFLADIKKDYEEAEKYYLKALTMDPDDAKSNVNYAVFLNSIKKDYEEAEKYYLNALTIDPDHANNNGTYAVFLKNIKRDYEEAEKYYLKALTIDPDHANNNGNYAIFLKDIKKDNEKAEKYYLKALTIDPDHANNNGSYAVFLTSTQNYEKAEKYYLKALAIDPDHAISNGNYAQLLFITNKNELAEQHLLKALQHAEENDLLVELWFYRFAHMPEYYEEAEVKIKELLNKGIRSIGWDFSRNIQQAIKNKHPYPEKLKELAKRITEE